MCFHEKTTVSQLSVAVCCQAVLPKIGVHRAFSASGQLVQTTPFRAGSRGALLLVCALENRDTAFPGCYQGSGQERILNCFRLEANWNQTLHFLFFVNSTTSSPKDLPDCTWPPAAFFRAVYQNLNLSWLACLFSWSCYSTVSGRTRICLASTFTCLFPAHSRCFHKYHRWVKGRA